MEMFCAAAANPARRPAAVHVLRDFIPRLLKSSDNDRVNMYFVSALTMVGDLDGAFDLMKRLLDQRLAANGSGGIDWGEIWTPEMRAFRKDARFGNLMARVKLPDYWKQYGAPDECELNGSGLICH